MFTVLLTSLTSTNSSPPKKLFNISHIGSASPEMVCAQMQCKPTLNEDSNFLNWVSYLKFSWMYFESRGLAEFRVFFSQS